MRNILKAYLEEHHPNEKQKLEIGSLDDTAHSENELLRIAQEHFATNTSRNMAKRGRLQQTTPLQYQADQKP
jgi:hypothetical protein